MRELSFRGWHPKLKEMFDFDMWIPWEAESEAGDTYYTKNMEIMQFTGLKDKNGVEIYEGDIWKRDTFISTVEFKYSQWTLTKTESSGCYQYPTFHSNAETGEVIGNIYSNPELLEN